MLNLKKSDIRRNIDMAVGGEVEIGAAVLGSKSHSHYTHGDVSGYATSESVRHEVSNVEASGSVNIATGGNFALLGSGLEAVKDISIRAGGSARVESLVEMDHSESHREESDDSFLGLDGDSVEHFSSHEERLVKSSIASGRGLRVESGGEQVYRGAEIGSGGRTSIVAPRIEFLAGLVHSSNSSYSSEEGRLTLSIETIGSSSTGVVETSVIAKGGLVLDARDGVYADVTAGESSLRSSLRGAIEKSDVAIHPYNNIHYNTVSPSYDSYAYEQFGLTEGGAALVSIGAAALTAGVGGSFGGSVASSLTSNAILASAVQSGIASGVTATASRAAVSIINNQGLLEEVGKDLASKDAMTALGKGMLTSGMTGGLTEAVGFGDLKDLSNGSSGPGPRMTEKLYGGMAVRSFLYKYSTSAYRRILFFSYFISKASFILDL